MSDHGDKPPRIPSRNTEWDTPFSDPRPINAEADATHTFASYSPRRRWVAIGVTVLLSLWILGEITYVIQYVIDTSGDPNRAFGFFNLFVVLFRLAVGGFAMYWIWRWANKPVAGSRENGPTPDPRWFEDGRR